MLSRNSFRYRSYSAASRWSLTVAVLVTGLAQFAVAQTDPASRPDTQDLLPETTVAFVQIDDFRDLMEKMGESSIGQLTKDEAIAPLMEGLWDEAKIAYEDVREQVGVDLDDFTALPHGELTFAVIAPRRKDPEFMLIVELDDENEAVDRVLDRGRQLIVEEAGEEITTEESDDGIEFESFMVDGKKIKFFRKDGLMVGSSSEEELDAFIDRWMGREVEKVRPLSANRKFITIMNRCTGTNELKPEARFFVDPISLAKSSTRGNFAVQAAINFLPVLGLDGLLGVGGSMILSEDDFESVVHGHILLANPRKGVFEMIALKPTDYQPEPWLPADISSYMTTSWDIDQMLAELTKMIEMYQGEEGVVDEWLENNINEELGLNVKEDLLAHLSGRVTYAEWISYPIGINSQVQIFALELTDPEAFETSFEAIIERVNRDNDEDEPDSLLESEYKGFRTWSVSEDRLSAQMERRRERREERGQDTSNLEFEAEVTPRPAFAIVGNYLLMSFASRSNEFIEHAIDTNEGDFDSMVNDEAYQSIATRMTRMLKSDMPCAMMYSNPEHAFRWMIELAGSDRAKTFLAGQAEDNKYVAGLKQRLDDNPLPNFDDLKKYFRPSGGFGVSDDTGYHFLAFNLRADPESEASTDQ